MTASTGVRLNRPATELFIAELHGIIDAISTPFERARIIARHLGAHLTGPAQGRFGYWAPEIGDEAVDPAAVTLELYRLPDPVDFSRHRQELPVQRFAVEVIQDGEFLWAVIDGVRGGTRERTGTFYRLAFTDRSGTRRVIHDPLAHSVPFGAAAPAELYDMATLFADRSDAGYFSSLQTQPDPDGTPRVSAPVHMLEIHVPTATAEGTLAALSERYRAIAASSSPAGDAVSGYEAVQLMPIEPTILFEEGAPFWDESEVSGTVRIQRPDTTNWGYDVITVASPAPNPTLLRSGRPDELLDFVTTMHTLPTGPVKVVFDVVYGHADNQALKLLNRHYFAGANMYGQNLNYTHPVVRAILLEMQRRKSDYGVDGIRVDGAQDFKYWVESENRLYHDDAFLSLMNDVTQTVAGTTYRPWMVFEDGRPWPRDDWELSSTYREVTRKLPNVVQWGPLTFAHNTPFLFTFWVSKWWRLRELLEVGSHWITGTSNHDTLRRGTQVDPEARLNTYLGSTLPEIFENGYGNPAAHLLDCFLPGIPMDFYNANLHAPWSFIRNTDHRWAIKVVSEEARFLDWAVTGERFNHPWAFPRLKEMGFRSLRGLRQFLLALEGAIRTTEYDPEAIARLLNALTPHLEGPAEMTGQLLRVAARAWMDDVHQFCNTTHYRDRVDTDPVLAERASFALQVRQFRRANRWLRHNLDLVPSGQDFFDYLHPADGSVVMYGRRSSSVGAAGTDTGGPATLFLVANMEGAPREVLPAELAAGAAGATGAADESRQWKPVLITPLLRKRTTIAFDAPLTLHNGEAALFSREHTPA